MPKKKVIKVTSKEKKFFPQYFRLIIFTTVIFLLVLGVNTRLLTQENYRVLGTTTYLASSGSGSGDDGGSHSGDDSGGNHDDNNSSNSGGSGSSDSSNSGGSGSGSSGEGSSGSSNSNSSSSTSTTNVTDNTKVLCTGPDGKQFETKFEDCKELNQAWNRPVNYKALSNPSKTTSSSVSPTVEDTLELEDEDSTIKTKTETKENEEKNEVRLSETERIRTRTKDGKTRIDITSNGIKTRYEIRDDRVIIKAEQEDGTEVELEDDTLFKIDDRLAKDNIRIATAGAEKFIVQRGTTGAITDFPLSVDLATNKLFVNTPSGEKELTVLPEQAIQNIIAANIVSRLGGQAIVNEAKNNNLTSVSQIITLGEKNGIPVYEINGISDQKLLGIIPVVVEKEIAVSAETGNAVSIDQSLASKIIDALSF